MPEDVKKLFQITEAARACSLSRSTLLRLEEKGLLTPAYIAPEEHLREGHTIAEKYNAMYDFYGECVRRGYRLSDEPIFTISQRQDFLNGYITDEPYPFFVCVPVRPEKAPTEAVVLPACRALSVLYYGSYAGADEAFLRLGREVKQRGLTPAGDPRVLGIVAPYTGREIETKRYCSRLVLPVEGEPELYFPVE